MHLKKERQINSTKSIINNSFSSMNNNDSIDLDKPRHLDLHLCLIFEYFFPYIYIYETFKLLSLFVYNVRCNLFFAHFQKIIE